MLLRTNWQLWYELSKAGTETVQAYNRADVLRILRITGQQLAQWQKAGLVAAGEVFSFFDLLQLKKIRDLRARHVRTGIIRQSLMAMQKQVAGMENPLLEAGTYNSGSRVVFRHRGYSVEPVSGQFMLDFASTQRVVSAKVKNMPTASTAAEFFARGVALEDDPQTVPEAIRHYQQALELEPGHAATHINLGTIYYNRQDFARAEHHYRKAVEADPKYALAYFDLGNVLDETGRVAAAVDAYRIALALAPTYADVHYNIALAYEKLKQPRKALHHWKAYLKLDRTGPWATHARNQVRRILEGDGLKIVYRRG